MIAVKFVSVYSVVVSCFVKQVDFLCSELWVVVLVSGVRVLVSCSVCISELAVTVV